MHDVCAKISHLVLDGAVSKQLHISCLIQFCEAQQKRCMLFAKATANNQVHSKMVVLKLKAIHTPLRFSRLLMCMQSRDGFLLYMLH